MFGSFFSNYQIGKSKKSGDEWFYHEFPIQFGWNFRFHIYLNAGRSGSGMGGIFWQRFFLVGMILSWNPNASPKESTPNQILKIRGQNPRVKYFMRFKGNKWLIKLLPSYIVRWNFFASVVVHPWSLMHHWKRNIIFRTIMTIMFRFYVNLRGW